MIESEPEQAAYPQTPDGRYFVVRERLWRLSNPGLHPDERAHLVDRLMTARRAVAAAKMADDKLAMRSARAAVDRNKRALGERGAVWWDDGAPDYNRHIVHGTPYAPWYSGLKSRAAVSRAD
jgi:hypothetical protein